MPTIEIYYLDIKQIDIDQEKFDTGLVGVKPTDRSWDHYFKPKRIGYRNYKTIRNNGLKPIGSSFEIAKIDDKIIFVDVVRHLYNDSGENKKYYSIKDIYKKDKILGTVSFNPEFEATKFINRAYKLNQLLKSLNFITPSLNKLST
jgi:hypothetical protein